MLLGLGALCLMMRPENTSPLWKAIRVHARGRGARCRVASMGMD